MSLDYYAFLDSLKRNINAIWKQFDFIMTMISFVIIFLLSPKKFYMNFRQNEHCLYESIRKKRLYV